jgi:hypothetical protein
MTERPRSEPHNHMTTLEPVLEVLFLSPRSGRQGKAWGGAAGETPGKVRKAIKPTKWAAALRTVAHFVGFERFTNDPLGRKPQALCCRLLRRLKSQLSKHALMVVTTKLLSEEKICVHTWH